MKVLYLHNLGCAKNQVEGELLAGWAVRDGIYLTSDPFKADVIVVNTCAFIQEAKEEAIEAILEAARLKATGRCRTLYVCGCFPQRYRKELPEEFPEVDGFFGVNEWRDIHYKLTNKKLLDHHNLYLKRQLWTPKHYSYLRIADGCDRKCTYCIIPKLRGRYKSRPAEEILEEAQNLAKQGTKELWPVAQELNSYGHDLGMGSGNKPLIALLKQLCKIDGISWIRPLYFHPPVCDEELWEFWASQSKLCRYLDLPVEHGCDRILKAMGRGGSKRQNLELIRIARRLMPDVAIRSSIIVGFPGETDKEFEELLDFVREIRFERLGFFRFSAEEGTPAYDLPAQIPEELKEERLRALMDLQSEISQELNQWRVGKYYDVFVDDYEEASGYSITHRQYEIPELDGEILIPERFPIGSELRVRIESATEYDLFAKSVRDSAS